VGFGALLSNLATTAAVKVKVTTSKSDSICQKSRRDAKKAGISSVTIHEPKKSELFGQVSNGVLLDAFSIRTAGAELAK